MLRYLLLGSAIALLVAPGCCSASVRSLVTGNVRFSVIAPDIIRMEYGSAAKFVDVPSVAVTGRDSWPECAFESEVKDGWRNIKTSKLSLRYKEGSGPFTAENLLIEWTDGAWKPGDKDERNLGGVPGDIAHRTVPVADPGPLSRNGYYLLDDSRTALWNKATEWVEPRPEKDSQDWYFLLYGRDYAGALNSLMKLTGPIPMVPRYTLGIWFGSRAAYSAQQWKMIAERFAEEQIPLDVFIIDSCSWTDVVWSGYDWDREQMPDPEEFFKWMNERDIHVSLNEHYAALTPESDHNFETIRKEMGLPADTKEIAHDLASKKYAGLFMDLLHKPALDMGMAFWWQDGCAPANMDGLEPMMWTREIEYKGTEEITGKRPYVFCRLGAWGSHRSGAFFSGDLVPEWKALEMLIPFNVRAGNQLVAYPANLTNAVYGLSIDPELYTRWMQFGSFSPIFWFHGLWGLRLPWEYGADGMNIAAEFMRLRESLIPYSYTYARIAHDTGMPLVRGMYLDYPDQEQAYTFADKQYMFGRDILVSPITEDAHGKPALKDVYLPEGDSWFDYFTGRISPGGQVIAYECPLERMPLFVRAGAIIPSGTQPDSLSLDVYASDKASSFRLYEDDGESLDYRKNGSAWTPFEVTPSPLRGGLGWGLPVTDGGPPFPGRPHPNPPRNGEGVATLKIGPTVGKYKGQPASRRYDIRIHGLLRPDAVKLNGKEMEERRPDDPRQGWSWDAKTRITTIHLLEPLSTGKEAVITLDGAGTFADALALQQVMEFRDRIRSVKLDQKLKYAIALTGREHAKPPWVIRETEEVEMQLDALVAHPRGIASNPPDLRAMTERVLKACVTHPFDSTRVIPDKNATCLDATQVIAGVQFEPEELSKMTATLLGLNLQARMVWDNPQPHFVGPYLHVYSKLEYDRDIAGEADVKLQIELPQDALPGWGQLPSHDAGNGYTAFELFYPTPSRPDGQTMRIKAHLTWPGGETDITREMEWR